ncbi:MAG: ATP-binding protein [Chloroflexi bacterium]|nr:ATP-binding protein [Chloroflexota bacterium]
MESLGDVLKRLTPKSTSAGTGVSAEAETPEDDQCPQCGGQGWLSADVPVGHAEFGKVFPCSCQASTIETDRLTRLQQYSNLGALTRMTFQALDSERPFPDSETQRRFHEAYQAASEYADEPQGWLALNGPVGSGKTHLAAAIVNRCLDRGVAAFYISVPDLLDHLRSAFGPTSDVPYDQLFDQVRNAPLLALDDLGAHATTPWAQEKLNQILNHRFNLQLPTVVALSVPMAQLEEQLRARLEDKDMVVGITLGQHAVSSHWRLDRMKLELMRRMTFDTFSTRGNRADMEGQDSLQGALHAARVFAQEPSDWLVFTGVPGCGKTHLAVSIINERMAQGQSVLFAFVPDLLDYLRFTFSPQSSVTYDQFAEEIRTTPLLVLDDLGAHSSTAWAEEKLYQVMVYRQEARLPTVITVRGFIEDLPDSVSSRLKDVGLVTMVPIVAPDYRDSGARQGRGSRTYRRGR